VVPTTTIRLICSVLVLGISWAISGSIFVALANGSDLLKAWLIGGTLFFVAGWVVVGLPLVALGSRICSPNYFPFITIAAGTAGGAIVFILELVMRSMDRAHHYPWSLSDLVWPGIAFSIAAPTALVYCILLRASIIRQV
jgi:hypothetical protein